MAQAIVHSLAVSAARGVQRAQRPFTELLATTERENRRRHDALLETAIAYKAEWERDLERRERLGIRGPAPLPHPDDVVIDLETGEVRIIGPMGERETGGIGGPGGREAGVEAEDDIQEFSELLP
ncbi:MAG TPA: hypothetical protein VK862_01700 [Afifellaceae bacterium]|nr:hypothetical protein [Afifellaceae bacterium]